MYSKTEKICTMKDPPMAIFSAADPDLIPVTTTTTKKERITF
jgi:hypothetical protein